MKLVEIQSAKIDESYFCGIHESGLSICIYPKNSRSTCAFFGTKFGSINTKFRSQETGEIVEVPDGIAHYLEHKLFESEDGDSFQKFSKTGAYANAFTSFDVTSYWFSCTENFYESFDILLEFVQDPYFTEKSVEKERGIIASEIKQYEDEPGWRVLMNLRSAMYKNHPVRVDIAGSVDSIQKINPDNLMECYKNFYNLNNMCLCVTGNIDKDEVLDFIEKKLKKNSPINIKSIFEKEPYEVSSDRIYQELDVAMPEFMLGFKENANEKRINVRDYVLTGIILNIFSSQRSALYRELLDKGLINNTFYHDYFEGPGYSSVDFGGESYDPDEVAKIIRKRATEFKEDINSISMEELNIAKKDAYGSYVSLFDDPKKLNGFLFENMVSDREIFSFIDIVSSVELDDVRERLFCQLDSENSTLSIIAPIKK